MPQWACHLLLSQLWHRHTESNCQVLRIAVLPPPSTDQSPPRVTPALPKPAQLGAAASVSANSWSLRVHVRKRRSDAVVVLPCVPHLVPVQRAAKWGRYASLCVSQRGRSFTRRRLFFVVSQVWFSRKASGQCELELTRFKCILTLHLPGITVVPREFA